MLEKLKSILRRPPETVLDFVFHPQFPTPFQLGALPTEGGTVAFGATGSAPWFSSASESDRQVLMIQPEAVLETDSLQVLQTISDKQYAPHHRCVLFQPWREPAQNPKVRWLGAMTPEMGTAVGKAVSLSPVQHLYLVTGGITRGAIDALTEALDGQHLETVGLFWYFSGDDMTDEPAVMDEIAKLCAESQTQRLSILSAAVDSVSENRLIEGLKSAPSLKECSVFEKDDHAKYPRFRTPMLDTFLRDRQ